MHLKGIIDANAKSELQRIPLIAKIISCAMMRKGTGGVDLNNWNVECAQ